MLQWRGRWRQQRNMEIYIQEVATSSLLPVLPYPDRERIRWFASTCAEILRAQTARLQRAAAGGALLRGSGATRPRQSAPGWDG